jgi:DNA-binding CsgD family transcriptional regulator
MNKSLLKQVNERHVDQPFDLFDPSFSKERSLSEFFLFPNQVAYKVDCRTAEVIEIVGDLKGMTGIEKMETLEVFQERLKPVFADKYALETMSVFKYLLGDGKRLEPLRNSFNSITEISLKNQKKHTINRQTFALKSDQNGIMLYSGCVMTILDGVRASPLPYQQHNCVGEDSIYYRSEELKRFNNVLSLRELEVLKLIAQGYNNKAIAGLLHLSPSTVETHRKNMLHKVEVKNSPHLVALAKDMGLI